jgi:hypothetical protein
MKNNNEKTGFLRDDTNKKSSIRILVCVCTLTMLGVWAILSIKNNVMQTIDIGTAMAFATPFGGKVVQKWLEKK